MTAVTTDQDEAVQALSRRKMFAMCSLGVLGATGLAACSSDSTATSEPAAAATTTGSDSATATASADASAGSDAVSLVKLADVPVGGGKSLEVAGKPVIVSQPTKGEVVGFSAVCPHQFATVAISGKEIRCPLHGSTFDLATGKNLTGPAAGQPLPSFAVKVVDGEVVQA